MIRRCLFIVAVLLAAVFPAVPVSSASQQLSGPHLVLYESPIPAPVVDPFRPPAHIGAPGNRGLQYGSSENHAVRTAAPGRVAFAGQVGRRKVITVEHADGVRTTYTGLRDIWVTRGQFVTREFAMGVAIARFHFGARLGNHYLDPQILLDASQQTSRARLIAPPG